MTTADSAYKPADTERFIAWAPASLSNLGPGFDCLGMAIGGWGDTVEAVRSHLEGSLTIQYHEESPWRGPTDAEANTAGVAAKAVLDALGTKTGINLIIRKGMVPGSGTGSSAASAAAAAWAVNLLMGSPLAKKDLVPAVLEGEMVAAGSRHGDNVLPALFGGMHVVSAADPTVFRQLDVGDGPVISVLLPHLNILTKEARRMLSETVALETSVVNASNLALLVSAIAAGDWAAAGAFMMTDRIVEPVRAKLVPEFEAVRTAALNAGAHGCTLSGSGPAIFAVSDSEAEGARILEAMQQTCSSFERDFDGIVTRVDRVGARQLSQESVL